jgi:large subunit ribosomal protein L10
MPQQYKIDKLESLKGNFTDNKNLIFADYRGLSVEKITELRNELRKVDTTFMVIKNNYIKRIGEEQNYPDLGDNIVGPTAVAFNNDDVSAALKSLFKIAKDKEVTFKVKGGLVDGQVYDTAQLDDLSKLPSKPQLIAMLMSTMQAPLQNFVMCTNDIVGRLVRVMNAVAEQKK